MKTKYIILKHPEEDFFTVAKTYCEWKQEPIDIQAPEPTDIGSFEIFLSCLTL